MQFIVKDKILCDTYIKLMTINWFIITKDELILKRKQKKQTFFILIRTLVLNERVLSGHLRQNQRLCFFDIIDYCVIICFSKMKLQLIFL